MQLMLPQAAQKRRQEQAKWSPSPEYFEASNDEYNPLALASLSNRILTQARLVHVEHVNSITAQSGCYQTCPKRELFSPLKYLIIHHFQ